MKTPPPNPQNASAVLMVQPNAFGFNPQTAADNEFMHLTTHNNEVAHKAMAEYKSLVASLKKEGVGLVEYEPKQQHADKPDAVFPNNWLSTCPNGTTIQYLMRSPNRQAENQFYPEIAALLNTAGYNITASLQLQPGGFGRLCLEGTGSLVFDHVRRVAYMALSDRSGLMPANYVCNLLGYRLLHFEALSRRGLPFYHTNVMMSVGQQYAIVCLKAIKSQTQRQKLIYRLERHHEIIDISLKQAEEHFCGNVLQLQGRDDLLMAMSEAAWNGFSQKQQRQIETHGKPLVVPIPTIEYVGGGSVRCMLAEIFLPRQAKSYGKNHLTGPHSHNGLNPGSF